MTIFDPCLTQPVGRTGPATELNGTTASLGVLMGHVFRRSSGRGWRLRKRSMELWPHWINRLQPFEPELALQRPLLQVAPDKATKRRFNDLVEQRQQLGLRALVPEELTRSGQGQNTVDCAPNRTVAWILWNCRDLSYALEHQVTMWPNPSMPWSVTVPAGVW